MKATQWGKIATLYCHVQFNGGDGKQGEKQKWEEAYSQTLPILGNAITSKDDGHQEDIQSARCSR